MIRNLMIGAVLIILLLLGTIPGLGLILKLSWVLILLIAINTYQNLIEYRKELVKDMDLNLSNLKSKQTRKEITNTLKKELIN
jgi:hypothetical protein